MWQRSFRVFVLLCLLVNAIFGSPRIHTCDVDEYQRHLRHASCPSCRRERPDALVSWAMPPRREYRDLEPETDSWHSGQTFRTNPFFYPPQFSGNPYNRASRSRGGPAIDRFGGTCKRENPFTFGRGLDFNVAPAQAAPAYSMTGPVTPQSPRISVPRSPARTPYRKPNFYDVINSQSDSAPSNRYSNRGTTNGAESFENAKRFAHHPSGTPQRDFRVVYRADKHPEEVEEDYEEEIPMIEQQQYPRTPFSQRKGIAGVQMQQSNQYVQQRREQPEDFDRIYEPRIKQNPYNVPADLNAYRTMQNIERDAAEVVANNTRWHHRMEEHDEGRELESPGVHRMDENGEQEEVRMVEMMNNARHQNNGHFDFSEVEPEEEVKDRRQMTESNKASEEFSTQTTMDTTEKVTKSSPAIMQIPRRVTVGA